MKLLKITFILLLLTLSTSIVFSQDQISIDPIEAYNQMVQEHQSQGLLAEENNLPPVEDRFNVVQTVKKLKEELLYLIINGIHFNNKYELVKIGGKGDPVVFIHGMSVAPHRWTEEDKFIPALKEKGFFEKHTVYTYEYKWWNPIMQGGEELLKALNKEGINNDRLLLVGHSMGGLIIRAYLHHGGNVKKVVTIGTPHEGSYAPTLSPKEFIGNQTVGVKDILPDSEFMETLRNSENDKKHREKFTCFAGQIGWKNLKFYRKDYAPKNKILYAVISLKIFMKKFTKLYGQENMPSYGWRPNDGAVPVFSALFEVNGGDRVERFYPVKNSFTKNKENEFFSSHGSLLDHTLLLSAKEEHGKYIVDYINNL